jgi:hypothetical protein
MKCLFCYNNFVHVFNQNTKERKGFITYGITTLKKHVNSDHATIVKKIEQKVNVIIKGPIERQLATMQKCVNMTWSFELKFVHD